MKLFFKYLIISFISLFFLGCHKASDNHMIRIGTIEGPETELMEVAKEVAKKEYNLDIEIVTFSDYTLPNMALNEGSLDANMFQHMPYLEASKRAHGFQIVSIGKTFVYPMGLYSKKVKIMRDMPTQSMIAIPNDPANEARALLLLQHAGIIKLKRSDYDVTPIDISDNPKNIQLKELDAAQLPRALEDVTFAVINTNYAVPAGLLPSRDALVLEDANSPYANIVVVREADKKALKFQKLVNALHSPQVVAKAKELFHDQAIPAW